jgi:hypothetical protein
MKRNRQRKDDYIALQMLKSCFSCYSEEAKQVMLAFASYVGGFKINKRTAPLFLKILETNEPEVINVLLQGREPFFLFRHIKPKRDLLATAFEILSEQDPISICKPVLVAVLGLIDMAYKNPVEGNTLHEIGTFELNHLAKYLNEKEDQYQDINYLILRILEYFYHAEHELPPDQAGKNSGIYSMRIRLNFLDKKHSLHDIIPEQLLGPLYQDHPRLDSLEKLYVQSSSEANPHTEQ